MPDASPLPDYIAALKGQGASDESVVALLRQSGWCEKRIDQAFGEWYESRTGQAVPNGGGRLEAAKGAFFCLLTFITLGIWTLQPGSLLFTVIDLKFPNPALTAGKGAVWTSQLLTNDLAGILVAFPLFLLGTRTIVRSGRTQPEGLESPVRKWLTYIALVIAASTMTGDVVLFLSSFLRGDLSTRFVFQVLTVLVIAAGVFGYYRESLRGEAISESRNAWFALAATAAVLLGVTAGFLEIG